MKSSHWFKLVLLVALVFGGYVAIQIEDFEKVLDPQRIVVFLQSMGILAPLVFIGMMATAVVISLITSLPLDLAAGAVFGPFLGTLYAVIGAEIGAIVSFLIGRALGCEMITKLLRVNVVFCQKCTDHQLMVVVALARLFPVFSFDLVSYVAGLTNMSLKVFALATLIGMIPPTFALKYLGESITTMQWPIILAGLALVGVFLFLPKWILKNQSAWWVRLMKGESLSESGEKPQPILPTQLSATECEFCGGPK